MADAIKKTTNEKINIIQKKAEFYTPEEKHFALMPMYGEPVTGQWWFHQAVFDNGWTVQINFMIMNWIPDVWLELQSPDGVTTVKHFLHAPEDLRYVPEVHDISFGRSRIHGKWPNYEMHVEEEGFVCDLAFEEVTQSVFMPPDGVFVGRMQSPATPVYLGYAVHPRSLVSGKMIVEGKEISVKGEGYHDHQWQNTPQSRFPATQWHWSSIKIKDYTLMWWDMTCSELGYQHFSFLWCLKGKEVIEFEPHCNYYVVTSDFEIDPVTMFPCQKKIQVLFDMLTIKGTMTYQKKKVLISYPLGTLKEQTEKGNPNRVYRRLLADLHVDLEILGEKVVGDSVEIIEFGL